MISFGVVMLSIFLQGVPQRTFAEKDHLLQRFLFDAFHEPLQMSAAIGTSRRQHDWLNVGTGFQKFAERQELGVAVDIFLNNGSIESAGIYVNNESDVALFRVGCQVEVIYALDELKQQPSLNGGGELFENCFRNGSSAIVREEKAWRLTPFSAPL
ncbi:MAG: hypothetical protein NT013_08895 [Planctomycetia bacterium]|nr:hypothetical protein [Planctomycetia bacterium]